MIKTEVIYVALLDEGTSAWRPVIAEQIGQYRFIITSRNSDPDDGKWQFVTGDVVRCEMKEVIDGKAKFVALVAVEDVKNRYGGTNKTYQKTLRLRYREMIEVITRMLNEWDPYDLVRGGAPDDEFAREAAQISVKISEIITPMQLAEVISEVFSKAFASEPYFSVDACLPVASRLLNELRARGLLEKTGHLAQQLTADGSG